MKNANERLRAIGGLCEPLIIVMDAASGFLLLQQ